MTKVFYYLSMYPRKYSPAVAQILGPYPTVREMEALGGYDACGLYTAFKQSGLVHIEHAGGCFGASFSQLGLQDLDRLGGLRVISEGYFGLFVGCVFHHWWKVAALMCFWG